MPFFLKYQMLLKLVNQSFFFYIFHMETSPLSIKGLKFLSMLGTQAMEQWGFFSVSQLLWNGASVYNGHLRGRVTLTPNAERLADERSLPVLTTSVCSSWDSNTQPSAFEGNALTDCAATTHHSLKKSPSTKYLA